LTGVKGSGPHGRRTQREGPAESPQEGGRPTPGYIALPGVPPQSEERGTK